MLILKEPQSTGHRRRSWAAFPDLRISRISKPLRTYQYNPLPTGNHVRYFVLQPGKGKEILSCHLYTSELASLPGFETISYVWGGGGKTAQIQCDGQIIRITANLRDVLRRVRLLDKPRTLWADLICINQLDLKEQGEQVAIMGQIYAGASRTLIWLGPDNGRGGVVATLLHDVTQMIKSQLEEFGSWDQMPSLDPEEPVAKDPRWKLLGNMILSPWFNRVWVVQEAALARDARVLYGSAEFSWSDLLQVHHWTVHKARFLWRGHQLYLNDIYQLTSSAAEATDPARLIGVLARAKTLQCSKASDRIYAFLGLSIARAASENRLIMNPDYGKSHLEVYHEFAEEILKHTNDLSILSAVDHTSDTFKSSIPSWVPRWDCTVSYDQFGLHTGAFNASKGSSQAILSFPFSATLRAHGFIVDRIYFRSKDLPGVASAALLALWDDRSKGNHNFLLSLWKLMPSSLQKLVISSQNVIPDKNKDSFVDLWTYLSDPMNASAYDKGGGRLWAFAKTLGAESQEGEPGQFTANEAAFCLWLSKECASSKGATTTKLKEAAENGDAAAFKSHATTWSTNRKFIVTNGGYYGLAPRIVEEGDICCVISGLRVPVILRKADGDRYHLVGEAFVFGLMSGQALENRGKLGLKEKDFILC